MDPPPRESSRQARIRLRGEPRSRS